jgi:hypothetical protein
MSKKRTRRQKENPHYQPTYTWNVKRELASDSKMPEAKTTKSERADLTAKQASLASTKRDIVKSLILVVLILIAELVVYLAWK